MKKIKNIFIIPLLVVLFSACTVLEVEDMVDPNGLSLDAAINNPNQKIINQLGVGIQSVMRGGLTDFYRNTGTVGREVVYSASTDNRYFNELLGTESANFNGANDPNGIFNTYYSSYSQTRRRAEVFIKSAETATILSEAQKAGIRGFCKTVQGYVMLNMLNMQGKNGIRESFSDLSSPGDFLKPGKFGTYESGLVVIKKILDDGAAELDKAGTSFPFPMTLGWNGFSTPTDIKKVNRAFAARVAMFQKDWAGMSSALSQSFLNLTGNLSTGPVFTFSLTAGDATNDLFRPVNDAGAPYVVFNEHIRDAEAGDTRLSKVRQRAIVRQSGSFLSFTHEVSLYTNNTSSVSIIRNEELILMAAEARIQLGDLAGGVAALNVVRTASGLRPLADAKPAIVSNKDGLIDEVLNQRRYSLFFEGHRWFDAKRYGKISILPLQTGTFKVFENFNRLDSEVQWDIRNPQ
jgi:starch-binding outer membrane protein, SusD/RagB family